MGWPVTRWAGLLDPKAFGGVPQAFGGVPQAFEGVWGAFFASLFPGAWGVSGADSRPTDLDLPNLRIFAGAALALPSCPMSGYEVSATLITYGSNSMDIQLYVQLYVQFDRWMGLWGAVCTLAVTGTGGAVKTSQDSHNIESNTYPTFNVLRADNLQ
eukprot:3751543-Pyramimonas_sp.AAC.1